MAKLYFKYGCMGSAKSLNLMITSHQFEEKSIPHLILKPKIADKGDEGYVSSRIGIKRECVEIETDTNIYSLIQTFIELQEVKFNKSIKWILVDESQFLTEEQVDQLSYIVDDFNINVVCYGLRTDFKSKLFEGSKRLFELSDTIEEIKSSCACEDKAIINARIDKGGNVLSDGEQILIGSNDEYIALCRKCWRNFLKSKKDGKTSN